MADVARTLEWEGGSLRHPNALVLYQYDFDKATDADDKVEILARFHPSCFNTDGTFRADVMEQIQLLATQIKGVRDA